MFCQKCGLQLADNAAFCSGCGAKLNVDAVQASYVVNPNPVQGDEHQTNSVENPQPISKVINPKKPNEFLLYLKSMWNIVLQVFKKPATGAMEYAKTGDEKTAWGFLGLQAISVILYPLSTILIIAIKSRGFFSYMNVPVFGIILTTLVITFGISCLFPAILMIINNQFFKDEVSYKQMLRVTAIASIAITAFTLVATVSGLFVSIISPIIGSSLAVFLISMGVLLSIFLVNSAIKGVTKLDDNKLLVSLFLSYVVMVIVILLLLKVCSPAYIPRMNFFDWF